MSSVAARPAALQRLRGSSHAVALTIVGLVLLTGLSLWMRTRALRAGFWIDEGLSVGIASHAFSSIPGVLQLDGSPPLYYMALHLWMELFGPGEGATHGLSVVAAVAMVPIAWWAGWLLAGTRAGWFAAVLAAFHPFLTYYAEETRMYALAALLSLLVAASFSRAFAQRDRRLLIPFSLSGAALLYTHNWGAFLLAGSLAGLAVCWWRDGDRRGLVRDALLSYGGIALLFLPWVPTLLSQAAHTGAPWANVPGLQQLFNDVLVAFGRADAAPLLLIVAGAGVVALLRPATLPMTAVNAALPTEEAERRGRAALALAAMIVAGVLLAFLVSQLSPAWTTRYFAVFMGPICLLGGIGLAHARGLGVVALALIVFLWADTRTVALEHKSNVRDVAASIQYRPVHGGDLVVSTHPEQVAVLHYYLGDTFRYATSLGMQDDPRVLDWRDGLDRLQAARPKTLARKMVDGLQPGQAVILVEPILRSYRWNAPWTKLVKRRTVQWERALNEDLRLRRVESFPRFGLRPPPRGVRAVIYRVRPTAPSP